MAKTKPLKPWWTYIVAAILGPPLMICALLVLRKDGGISA